MPFRDLQDEVDKWASQWEKPYWEPLEIMAHVSEENGEIARELNHLYGAKRKKATEASANLGDEICDAIFAYVCLANRERVDLSLSWKKMMDKKLYGRDKDRFKKQA